MDHTPPLPHVDHTPSLTGLSGLASAGGGATGIEVMVSAEAAVDMAAC